MKRATRCPGCGEPVSVFARRLRGLRHGPRAASARLDARRIELPPVPRPVRRSGFRLDAHIVLVALVLAATLLSPFLALIMAAVGAQDRHRNGRLGQRNLFIGLAILMGIRKFIKGFFPALGAAYGFNTPAQQNGIDGGWLAKPEDASPRRFGFYSVEPGHTTGRHPTAILRDYVVRVDAGSDELLLGKAYFAVGSARIPLGFFLLERRRPFEPGPELEEHLRD